MKRFEKLFIKSFLYFNMIWFCLFRMEVLAEYKVKSFKDLVNETGGDNAGGFSSRLTKVTDLMNDNYIIIRSVVVIIAIIVLYCGIMRYSSSKGGRGEMQGKDDSKRALIGIAIIAALGSIVTVIFNAASKITF